MNANKSDNEFSWYFSPSLIEGMKHRQLSHQKQLKELWDKFNEADAWRKCELQEQIIYHKQVIYDLESSIEFMKTHGKQGKTGG